MVRFTSGVQSNTIRFLGKTGFFGLPEVPGSTAFWDRALWNGNKQHRDGWSESDRQTKGLNEPFVCTPQAHEANSGNGGNSRRFQESDPAPDREVFEL